MSARARTLLFFASAAVFFALLVYGVSGLPKYGASHGTYELRRDEEAYRTRHVTNMPAYVNFDYRGVDTAGEEFIMFAAIAGLALLLREYRGKAIQPLAEAAKGREPMDLGEPLRWMTPGMVGLLSVFGYYVLIHGHLTPGGGFQAGAIGASALTLVYFAFGHEPFKRFTKTEIVEPAEALGAAGYVLVGLAALASGAAFLQNILPLGKTGTLFSSGTIFVINLIVGAEVVCAFLVMAQNFVEDRKPEEQPSES